MAHNPGTTLVIVQFKLALLLCKPHRLLHTIFFSLRLYICFHFSSHPFKIVKSVNSPFASYFAISIASSWRRRSSECTFVLVHLPYHLHKISLITWYFPCRHFLWLPIPWKTRSPFASFYYLSKYLEWLFSLLKSVQLIFDSQS